MAALTIKPAAGGRSRDVQSAVITMPRIGAWQASLIVEGTAALAGRVQIESEGLTLAGTVHRGDQVQGATRVHVIAGGNGLRKLARPKHYTSPTARLVLAELAAAAGEAISAAADAALLRRTLLAWTTLAIETGAMLAALVELLGSDVCWRLLADGTIWVGRESWPDSVLTDVRVLEESPDDGWLMLGVDVPRVIPGTLVGGRKADVVEHMVSPTEVRTRVWVT